MKLPIGIQTFEEIRDNGYLYVDKTKQIYTIIDSGKYFFLSRPRRFGKSLLLSTLKSLYQGRKDLFKDLWIENNWDWENSHPVLHIQFSKIDYQNDGLEQAIISELNVIASELNIELRNKTAKSCFRELIEKASTKRKVVILIDEYDKPIIDYLDDLEHAIKNRKTLKSFYSILKDSDTYIELLFITGVSQFSKTSIFSDLNNLTNLSADIFALDLVGFTYDEVEQNFINRLEAIAKTSNNSLQTVIEQMKFWYNGYSWDGEVKVYNPYSLLKFLRTGQYDNYWFESGTPTFLVNQLRKKRIYKIENFIVSNVSLNSYDLENLNVYTLLYQTGYLTIKQPIAQGIFELKYPNYEVKVSLDEYLLNAFAHNDIQTGKVNAFQIAQALKNGDIETMIRFMNATFATIPNLLWQNENEAFYHAILHLSLSLMGVYVQSELNTSNGRLDAKVTTDDTIYILEFKLDKSAEAAIQQIEKRGYFKEHQNDDKKLIGIGINFSKTQKGVENWLVKTF